MTKPRCGARWRWARRSLASTTVTSRTFPSTSRSPNGWRASPLTGLARQSGVLPVGVFRNASLEAVADAAASLRLHAVQLHGREDAEYVSALRRMLPTRCEMWTALSVGRDPLTDCGGDRVL